MREEIIEVQNIIRKEFEEYFRDIRIGIRVEIQNAVINLGRSIDLVQFNNPIMCGCFIFQFYVTI